MTVTAVVSTRNRYHTTLPMCIMSIITQARIPEKLVIYDDGDHKDLRNDPVFKHIFQLCEQRNIQWEVLLGSGEGQVKNHQHSLDNATTDLIWRLDDDNYAEADVLLTLEKYIQDKRTAAVGGRVCLPRILNIPMPSVVGYNKIDEILYGINAQWYNHTGFDYMPVDHLYSSFLYKVAAGKSIGGYRKDLSRVGHREETLFTFGMKASGDWDLYFVPDTITLHLEQSMGGIRDNTKKEMWQHDEEIFLLELASRGVKPRYPFVIVLDNGLGDHYAFLSILDEIKAMRKHNDIVIANCYPEVFDNQGIKSISIADAIYWFGNLDMYNIYKWMDARNWKGHITDAFRVMYGVKA